MFATCAVAARELQFPVLNKLRCVNETPVVAKRNNKLKQLCERNSS
jgi:hypothetical protein